MHYLDHDILQNALKDPTGPAARRIRSLPFDDIALSTIVVEEKISAQLAEIKSVRDHRRPRPTLADLGVFLIALINGLAEFQMVPYHDEAESVWRRFSGRSKRVGAVDSRLLAHALSDGAVVATGNMQDFAAILSSEDLNQPAVESWLS